jgi:CheY-like chemotaxis protein
MTTGQGAKDRGTKDPVILVVEEEAMERAAIAEHLEGAGFAVLQADSTDEALELLDGADLRALVTDAHLPGRMDGSELARTIRGRRPDLPVILMSGHSDLRDDELPEGVEFISKPYLLDRLVPTLRRLLEAA